MQQSGKKNQDPVSEKAIIPVSIHQINTMLKNDSNFEGQNFQNISIIGRLQSFTRKKSALFMFNDGTSEIECQTNMLQGKLPSFAESINFADLYGKYFFVVLKPKFNEEERKFNIVGIKQVKNYNQITKHFSDVILSYLIRVKR